jgi:hypothetical protein
MNRLYAFMLTIILLDDKVLPIVLPTYKEHEQVDFKVHHWEIKDWNSLEQRSHGPIFEAGGYQWYILVFSLFTSI